MDFLKKEFKCVILVVLYNCQISESRTLRSLLDLVEFFQGKDWLVCVWNNGPSTDPGFREYKDNLVGSNDISFIYAESIDNAPLSRIYNFIISKISSESYLILDQDSLLQRDFFESITLHEGVDFRVPRIIANNESHGPILNSKILKKDFIFELSSIQNFFAVGSGLVIYRSGLDKFLRHYSAPFDERFALYGVDSSFWIRLMCLRNLEPIIVSCFSKMEHSLSRLEIESQEKSKFRRKERGLDTGITLRRYPSFRRFFKIIKLITKIPFKKRDLPGNYPSIIWIAIGFIIGRHPRSKYSEINFTLYE